MKNKALILLLAACLAAGCRLRTSKDKDDDDNDASDAKTETPGKVIASPGGGVYSADYKAGVKTAQLNIDGAETVFTLADTTTKLFKAVAKNDPRKYTLSEQPSDTLDVVYFKSESLKKHKDDIQDASTDMRLNPAPLWDIYAKMAATQTTFDLSKFKVRMLGIELAVGEFDVTL